AIDNSPEGSTVALCRQIEATAPAAFRWAHEPNPGVAQARNAAIKLARGEYVAWLDDDEEASPQWLAALLAQRVATGAQSVFGPVRARTQGDMQNAAFFERLYSRGGPARSGPCGRAYGIGNSLQPRAMFDEPQPFDPRADQRGGEDDALFSSWADAGATFAWAADAYVIEHLGADRSERFLAAEFLREKLFRLLGDELPYGMTVEIEKFETEGRLRRIHAAIIVDKPGHKGIVIGKGGERLKRIASEARLELEKLFDGKVFLEVWVKVKSGWADDERALKSLGYE
ncbi:MAG TPA: KH domain-containing protein, partial [Pseudothauera hydrothermalis]|nr:KH domain-containing protein [Pseudothauera hydrothermalis]